ncbi:orotate phosphoribosyltransferase [Nocardia sp. JMUB6875]|uniref:phosphoribosyltransferase family protein n=1 Tax=Nocardia sp. JMUB6875 TaxID=3158170 RepID=UPI0032E60750
MTAELVFQTAAERIRELAQDLVDASDLYGDFMIGAGHAADRFDAALFETKPTILRRLASLLAERIPPAVDRLAGAGPGAVAVVTAVALETGLPFVIVRHCSKGLGGNGFLAGELHPGERVLIVDDVLGTGAGALRAAARLESAGASITGILAVLDAGGAENIAEVGYDLDVLYDRGRLAALYRSGGDL